MGRTTSGAQVLPGTAKATTLPNRRTSAGTDRGTGHDGVEHKTHGVLALSFLPAMITSLHLGQGPGAIIPLRTGKDLFPARVTRRSDAASPLTGNALSDTPSVKLDDERARSEAIAQWLESNERAVKNITSGCPKLIEHLRLLAEHTGAPCQATTAASKMREACCRAKFHKPTSPPDSVLSVKQKQCPKRRGSSCTLGRTQ